MLQKKRDFGLSHFWFVRLCSLIRIIIPSFSKARRTSIRLDRISNAEMRIRTLTTFLWGNQEKRAQDILLPNGNFITCTSYFSLSAYINIIKLYKFSLLAVLPRTIAYYTLHYNRPWLKKCEAEKKIEFKVFVIDVTEIKVFKFCKILPFEDSNNWMRP